jgi:hypothetical protein
MKNTIKKNIILGVLILLAGFLSCKKESRKVEIKTIVKEWTGKQIQFPKDIQCNILGKDTVSDFCSGLFQKEYKILMYIDSAGCSSCRLKLAQWKQLIEESDSLFQDRLGFLLFFQPKNKKDLDYLFHTNRFDYPVFIDMNRTINQLNHFPDKAEYQCFLLDKNNKVLMIGNPSLNLKIWELYKQTILGQTQVNTMPITSVSIECAEIEISDLQVGKKSTGIFRLKNTGNQPLSIARVDASCGCTVPSWDKKPIEPGEETDITIEIQPEESGFFHKTIRVYGNMKKGVFSLSVKGTVE